MLSCGSLLKQYLLHCLCRSVFGSIVGPNPLKGDNSGTQYYEGIRVRATPAPITYPSQTTTAVGTNTPPIPAINTTPAKVLLPVQQRTIKTLSPAPDSTAVSQIDSSAASSGTQTTPTAPASPILKAQLSAPPKPSSSNTSSQSQTLVTKVDSKSQVGPSPSLITLPLSLYYRSLPRSHFVTLVLTSLVCHSFLMLFSMLVFSLLNAS